MMELWLENGTLLDENSILSEEEIKADRGIYRCGWVKAMWFLYNGLKTRATKDENNKVVYVFKINDEMRRIGNRFNRDFKYDDLDFRSLQDFLEYIRKVSLNNGQ